MADKRMVAALLPGALLFAICAGASAQRLAEDHDVHAQRFAPQARINAANVARLREICRVRLANGGKFDAAPLYAHGVLYAVTARRTFAIDAADCAVLWRAEHQDVGAGPVQSGTGLALHDGRLLRTTSDGRMLALDANDGRPLWSTPIADPALGERSMGAIVLRHGMALTTVRSASGQPRIVAVFPHDGSLAWRTEIKHLRSGNAAAQSDAGLALIVAATDGERALLLRLDPQSGRIVRQDIFDARPAQLPLADRATRARIAADAPLLFGASGDAYAAVTRLLHLSLGHAGAACGTDIASYGAAAHHPPMNALFLSVPADCGAPFASQLDIAGGTIAAVDVRTGRMLWWRPTDAAIRAPLSATAGDLVFAGDMAGNLLALDAGSGRLLHRINTGGAIAGGVVSYETQGRQLLALTSGHADAAPSYALGLPSIAIFGVDGDARAVSNLVDATGHRIGRSGAGTPAAGAAPMSARLRHWMVEMRVALWAHAARLYARLPGVKDAGGDKSAGLPAAAHGGRRE